MPGPHRVSPAAAPAIAGPSATVVTVLEALRESPSSGSAVLWKLSTPRFRSGLGGCEHLQQILGNDLFRPLTAYRLACRGPLEHLNHSARQRLEFESAEGDRCAFLFALTLALGGEQEGCWLVSGIERQWDV